MGDTLMVVVVVVVVAFMILSASIRILREYERAVIFRLGRLSRAVVGGNGPGLIVVIPIIDNVVKVSLRTVVMDVEPQDVITKDNVSVKVNAVIYFRVVDPEKAIVEVEDYLSATSQYAQTTLRSVLGQVDLDVLLSERDRINHQLQTILDEQTDPWGIKVSAVEVKHVDLVEEMRRAMARQAEAERERRSKVINAEGEYQAAQRLADAATIIGNHPMALQLRFLQTLTEVAAENNSTTLFPVPIDLFEAFLKRKDDAVK